MSTTTDASSAEEAAHRATASDVAAVAKLCQTFVAALHASRGGAAFAADAELAALDASVISELMKSPDCALIVGTYNNVPVGFAIVGHGRAAHDGTTHAVVRLLFVEELARRVGVGQAILEQCLEWGTTHGLSAIDIAALPGDQATKSFLETQGFKARLLTMHRTL